MKKRIIFSIVIAIAPERNAEVLKSIEKINYPKERFEIITEIGKSPSGNRNKGVKKAKGELIFFVDDDAVVEPEILKRAEEFFSKHKEIDIAGGPQITPKDERGFARISGYALSSVFGAWRMSNRYNGENLVLDADETMLTSANLFCKKGVFKKVQFDTRLFPGEDPDFIKKAKEKRFGIAYSPDLIVYHRRRDSLKKLSKQIYSYGKTRPKKEPLKETLKMPFFLVPSVFVIYLFILMITAILKSIFTWSIIGASGASVNNIYFLIWAPLVLYLILNLGFSLGDAIINRHFAAFFILPFTYLAIHLSYGLGFLISSVGEIFKKSDDKVKKDEKYIVI